MDTFTEYSHVGFVFVDVLHFLREHPNERIEPLNDFYRRKPKYIPRVSAGNVSLFVQQDVVSVFFIIFPGDDDVVHPTERNDVVGMAMYVDAVFLLRPETSFRDEANHVCQVVYLVKQADYD